MKKKESKIKKGKIIVIDGIDGSGKTTQVDLLEKRLKKEKQKVFRLKFPVYEKNFFGRNIKKFLSEKEYGFLDSHPKLATIPYAADRFESKDLLNKYLDKGYLIILDRYVSSNQIHQGGKIRDEKERAEFLKWLDEMEYKVFKIPQPNLVLYLCLELATSQKLVEGRKEANTLEDYNMEYQKNSRESALWLSKNYKNIKVVDCDDDKGGIKTREEISDLVWDKIKKLVKIKKIS